MASMINSLKNTAKILGLVIIMIASFALYKLINQGASDVIQLWFGFESVYMQSLMIVIMALLFVFVASFTGLLIIKPKFVVEKLFRLR